MNTKSNLRLIFATFTLALLLLTIACGQRAKTIIKNRIGMEFVYVPAGSFMMGSEKDSMEQPTNPVDKVRNSMEQPAHQVKIREGFYMGKYEVTQAQWQKLMGNNPSHFDKGDNLPVEDVSWNDAREFIRKLNEMHDGYVYSLPSEAEWEYACRAGTTGDYTGNLDEMAWYNKNSDEKTHPVGQKQPNAFGLYDMLGNVWEWCQDLSHGDYNGAPTDGTAWENSNAEIENRILRGGSFFDSKPRSALRNWGGPIGRAGGGTTGLRVVALPQSR